MEFAAEIEAPEDIIRFAYGMEESLGGFYEKASGKTGDEEAALLLTKLAGIEEKHKSQLFDLFRSISEAGIDKTSFETTVIHGVLEGGLSTGDYLDRVTEKKYGLEDVFSVAMMFEAQAMDLYMRYSEEINQLAAKRLLLDLAQQEKGHLAALGEFMNRKA